MIVRFSSAARLVSVKLPVVPSEVRFLQVMFSRNTAPVETEIDIF